LDRKWISLPTFLFLVCISQLLPKLIFKLTLRYIFLLCILLLSGVTVIAQSEYVLSGSIFSAADSTPLPGAAIYDYESGKGSVTDDSGQFQINLTAGSHRLRISFLGFYQHDTILNVSRSFRLDFYLIRKIISYDEVTISAESDKDYIQSTQMSEIILDHYELSQLPSLLGSSDPIRFLQLTPGVQSNTEGGIGFYVRGGGVDQNLVLYDHAVLYNPGHLMGFLSVFNQDIIRSVGLIKAGIPARYGGRLSSVVNIESFKGHSDSLSVKGEIGLITSRITLNRSLNKNKGSFVLSARRTYIDIWMKPILIPLLGGSNPLFKESRYYFYDFNAGFSYRLGDKDYISLTAYHGRDDYGMTRQKIQLDNTIEWGNSVVSARWSHAFNNRLSLQNILSTTFYKFDFAGAQSYYAFSMYSSVMDYSYKTYVSYVSDNHKITGGIDVTRHAFNPNQFEVESGTFVADFVEYNKLYGYQGGIFIEDDIRLSDKWSIGAGLRYSFFNQVGPYNEYIKNEAGMITDTLQYASGESLAFFHHPEPRLSLKYQINNSSSVKASFMHMAQYVHLATSSSVSLPTDIWLPSSLDLDPQIGNQVSLGYYKNLFGKNYESSVEVYYKTVDNHLEFIRGIIQNSLNMTLMDNIAVGKGRSYGTEFFFRKKTGETTGWISYSLSRSEKQFDRINEGKIYPAKYDRRHDLSVAAIHRINDKWNGSLVFIYVSGNALTMPVGRYIIQGNLINEYGDVNSFRMPAYHRLDVSLTREKITKRGNISSWNFSVYNVYNRANPFYLYFETTGNLDDYTLDVSLKLVSLFPVIPSVSWRFEF